MKYPFASADQFQSWDLNLDLNVNNEYCPPTETNSGCDVVIIRHRKIGREADFCISD